MKIRSIVTLIAIFAFLLSGCGQVAPPDKGGSGGDNKQQENAEKRIYWFDDNTRTETKMGIVYSVNLGYKDKRQELEIPKPEPQSDYAVKSNLDFGVGSLSVISISKNKKFILTSAEIIKNFDIENGETYLVDGKKVEGIEVNEYSIYEPSTKEFHYIGALCRYEFSAIPPQIIKEIGHKYYPAGWMDDELLLVETTKDEKIYTEGQDASVKTDEITSLEVPYATARAMSFSLKDFKLSPTNKFKPLKPWVSYSDAQTGIIGYFDPFYKFPSQYFTKPSFPQSYDNKAAITSLTDLKCTKTYDLLDLSKKILPEKYTLVHSSFCGAIIDDMGKRICYYCMTGYPEDFNFGTEQDGLPSLPKIEQIVFKLNFDSGEIEKCLTTDQIHSEIRRLYGDTHDTTKTFSFFYECVADGITKETGPVMIIIGAFPDQKKEVDDWAFFFCRVVGKNLDKLEKTGLDDKTKLNPSFFIR